jgi:hypothetical protein
MLYYGELDVRFGEDSPYDIVVIMATIHGELAQKCEFYLEEDRLVRPYFRP